MAKSISRIKTVTLTIVEDDAEKEKKIKIEKVALGDWKRLTDTIDALFNAVPEVLENRGVENQDEFLENIEIADLLELVPDLLQVATDEVFNLLSIGSGLDVEFLEEKVGIDEAIDIAEAIIEVNNLEKVVDKGNKLVKWAKKIL